MRKPRHVAAGLAAALVCLAAAAAPPEIESIDPSSAPADRETRVELRGRLFEPGLRVTLPGGGPHQAGSFVLRGGATGVVCLGDLVYLSFYDASAKVGGFMIFDVSDPTAPRKLGFYDSTEVVPAISVEGERAYVPFLRTYTFEGGLHVMDTHDSSAPRRIETTFALSNPQRLVARDDHVYVADGGDGLKILDVSDASHPVLAGALDTPGLAWDVEVRGDHAFVADGPGGLQIVDVGDPSAPFVVSSVNPVPAAAVGAIGVAVAGDLVFVAAFDEGLQIIDVSDPAAPALRARVRTADAATAVDVSGRYAYVADGLSGLQVLDIADPAGPVWVGSHSPRGFSSFFFDVDVSGSLAYVADAVNGLRIIDVSRPAAPRAVAGVGAAEQAAGLVVQGSRAFVADGTDGIAVLDLTDPASPTEIARADTPGEAHEVVVAGDLAYVADGSAGLRLYDVSGAGGAPELGAYGTPEPARGVAIHETLAYVSYHRTSNRRGGFAVVDVRDPASPQRIGSYSTRGGARGLTVADTRVYLADGTKGLVIVDVSQPTAPRTLATHDTPGIASNVVLSGSLAFVVDGNRGLRVVDVSLPSSPELVGEYVPDGKVEGVRVDGTTAYVAVGFHGLHVVDFSDPRRPLRIASHDTPGRARDVGLYAGHAVVADLNHGVRVVRMLPRLDPPDVVSEAEARFTLPPGMAPGPYDVMATHPGGEFDVVPNGLLVCPDRALTAELVPTEELPPSWRLTAGGDPALTDPAARPRAWLRLPELPADVRVETLDDGGPARIELHRFADRDLAVVRLAGPDAAALQTVWDASRAAGGIALAGAGDGSFAELRLALHPTRGATPQVAPVRVDLGGLEVLARAPEVYRYDFAGGALAGARGWGVGADLRFELRARDDTDCEFAAHAGFAGTLAELCSTADPPTRAALGCGPQALEPDPAPAGPRPLAKARASDPD